MYMKFADIPKRSRARRFACAVAVLVSVLPCVRVSAAMACSANEAKRSTELSCHSEPSEPETPDGCGFALDSSGCCCIDDAPGGIPDNVPRDIPVHTSAKVCTTEIAPVASARIPFDTGFTSTGHLQVVFPGIPYFISHHALLI